MTRLIAAIEVGIAVGIPVAAEGAHATQGLPNPVPAGNATLYAYSGS
jgi:hypothetical protein